MMNTHLNFFRGSLAVLLGAAFLLAASCGKKSISGFAEDGEISVTGSPHGAELYLRGKKVGNLPARITGLKAGTYLLCIESPRELSADDEALAYSPRWVKVNVESGKRSPVEVRLEPQTATVLVTSEPSGADVLVAGERRGQTPYVLRNLAFGSYKIGLQMTGCKDLETVVSIPQDAESPGSPVRIHRTLNSDMGVISVKIGVSGEDSPRKDILKDCNALVDGKAPAYAPATENTSNAEATLNLRAAEGVHRIRIEKPGYESFDGEVAVTAGNTSTVSCKLKLKNGTLKLEVTPAEAKVTLNGASWFKPAEPRSLAPGEYQIEVSLEGYDTESPKLKVLPGELTEEKIKLARNTGELRFTVNPVGVTIKLDGKRIVGISQPDPTDSFSSREYRVTGLSVGKHTLEFSHPRAPDAKIVKFEIKNKGENVSLKKSHLWVYNANAVLQKDGRILKNVRIVPMGKNAEKVIYEPSAQIHEERPRSDFRKIEFLPNDEVPEIEKYKNSYFNLLAKPGQETVPPADFAAQNEPAVLRLIGLPRGMTVILNGEERGKSEGPDSDVRIIDLAPGSYTLEFAHPYGKNPREPGRNSIKRKAPLVLPPGSETKVVAPPLWIANADITLKNGTHYAQCRLLTADPKAKELEIEIDPGKKITVKASDIKKNIPLKD